MDKLTINHALHLFKTIKKYEQDLLLCTSLTLILDIQAIIHKCDVNVIGIVQFA